MNKLDFFDKAMAVYHDLQRAADADQQRKLDVNITDLNDSAVNVDDGKAAMAHVLDSRRVPNPSEEKALADRDKGTTFGRRQADIEIEPEL